MMDEEESLRVAKQQSSTLQQFLEDLSRVWFDAAARGMRGRFLDVHRREDEGMLHAFERQHALLGKMRAWLQTADMHMQQTRLAQRDREKHLEFAQYETEEAERERKKAMAEIKEAEDRLPHVLQLIQAANSAGH